MPAWCWVAILANMAATYGHRSTRARRRTTQMLDSIGCASGVGREGSQAQRLFAIGARETLMLRIGSSPK
jgi:hypothetical protein